MSISLGNLLARLVESGFADSIPLLGRRELGREHQVNFDDVSHFQDLDIELTIVVVEPPALPVGPAEGYMLVLSGEFQIKCANREIRCSPAGWVWLQYP